MNAFLHFKKKTFFLLSYILLTSFFFNSCGYYNRTINTSLKNNSKPLGTSVYEVDLIQDNYGFKFYTDLNKEKLLNYFKVNPQMELIESSIKYLDDNLTIKSFQYKGLTKDELKRIQQIEKLFKKSTNSGGKIAINNYQYNSSERKNNAIYDINYDDIFNWLNTHPELKYINNEYEKIYDGNGNYNGNFLKNIFVFNSGDENAKKTLCQEAIREAHKGAPFPNLSRDNISNAISACKECCKDDLESKFYSDIPTLKREIFVEYFPDSKYTPAVKQQINDIASGKMSDVSMLEAVGSAISNSETVKVLKEIGENSQSQSNSTSLSNTDCANIKIPPFKYKNWNKELLGDRQYIFVRSGNYDGTIYYSKGVFGGNYYQDNCTGEYYKTFEQALKALYLCRKCGIISEDGKK